ncbi:hypothetical protein [Bdellovibrio sp. HCB-162]|uniref:hypothetical protein n=1 Tax=Bdellovibrio sp. HCB-162 TaxID=3394234 RepID=UPI0039BCAC14
MGAFKEIYTETYGEAYFNELDVDLEVLDVELGYVDEQLELIDFECAKTESEVNPLLQNFDLK